MIDFEKELDGLQKFGEEQAKAVWAKFVTKGDSVQGTYVSVRRDTSPSGQEQVIYVLRTPQGLVNVGRNITDKRVHKVMVNAKLGEYVRFVLTDIIPAKRAGFNDIKAVDAYRRADLFDAAWLAENSLESTQEPDLSVFDGLLEDAPAAQFGGFSGGVHSMPTAPFPTTGSVPPQNGTYPTYNATGGIPQA